MKRWMMPVLAAGIVAAGVMTVRADDAAKPAPAPAAATPPPAAAAPAATTDAAAKAAESDKISYALGAMLAQKILDESSITDLNHNTMAEGFGDAMTGKAKYPKEELLRLQKLFFDHMQAKARDMAREAAKKNAEASPLNKINGEKFLAENKKKEGVKTTASGLQYKIIKEGTGKSPKASDSVVAKYRGTHLDGSVFDASDLHDPEGAKFDVGGVIPGWTEGLQLMKEGAKYTFYIPSDLAYGENGNPRGKIGGNEVLIFDVELVKVE